MRLRLRLRCQTRRTATIAALQDLGAGNCSRVVAMHHHDVWGKNDDVHVDLAREKMYVDRPRRGLPTPGRKKAKVEKKKQGTPHPPPYSAQLAYHLWTILGPAARRARLSLPSWAVIKTAQLSCVPGPGRRFCEKYHRQLVTTHSHVTADPFHNRNPQCHKSQKMFKLRAWNHFHFKPNPTCATLPAATRTAPPL